MVDTELISHLGFDTSRILHCHWCLHTQHNSISDTDCSVIDPLANPYISVLNPLIECGLLHDNCTHKIFAVLRYTRRGQILSVSRQKPAIMQGHSCFHYKGPQSNASLKKLKLF